MKFSSSIMLLKLLGRLLPRREEPSNTDAENKVSLDKANEMMSLGDIHGAIAALRVHLKKDPFSVVALNNLGVCLIELGDSAEAAAVFDLAYSLDDTYIPIVVNHARLTIDQRRSIEAIPYLNQSKLCEPEFPHVDSVYASFCLAIGDMKRARHFQLRAWMAHFDGLRFANSYLFYSAYDDIDELMLAAEHRFWAETVRPIQLASANDSEPSSSLQVNSSTAKPRKLRVGYWSPDFRNHSVRFFFRPLLAHHNRDMVDIFLYHDFPGRDAQTELMKNSGVEFHDVYELLDADLYKLMKSHELDVLVEMAGHSSHNRLALLQNRFAPLQITALGYPPTTGLLSVDAKLVDRHVMMPGADKYYAELPMVLPNSFWCFDPMEDAPPPAEPPFINNGYITFGCVGNIAKINKRILACWREILERVPKSRLLIRSISFEDPTAQTTMRESLIESGFDISLVDLRKPEAAGAFFTSYSEIDVILDTFPFNGGTTTCFAVYMGVPVVTLVGESLISRMGLSIMTNMGAPELAVATEQAYIEKAVTLAQDGAFLESFRRDARARLSSCSLGNGRLFAQEFEQACQALLAQKSEGRFPPHQCTAVLPADEMVRRAYAVLGSGQGEAAQRILAYCLREYPDSGSAHLLIAQQLVAEGRAPEAVSYLENLLDQFTQDEQIAARINLVRLSLLQGDMDRAAHIVGVLSSSTLRDTFDRLQLQLYKACLLAPKALSGGRHTTLLSRRVRVLVVSDSVERFGAIRSQLGACWYPGDWNVLVERCGVSDRVSAYEMALQDPLAEVLVMVQATVDIHNPMFLIDIAESLETYDLLGIAGATRWARADWRADEFNCKVAGFLTHSTENPDLIEIQVLGGDASCLVGGLAILDGNLIACRSPRVRELAFDAELLGADWLLEEDWTYSAGQAGLRLGVHRNLGISIDISGKRDNRARAPGLMRILEKYEFDPFEPLVEDRMLLSAPVPSPSHAMHVMNDFLRPQP
ncbi:MAG: hypothetical protein EOP38_12120 [Rubrivivax sp.]|nr:MAG: hypothetical protein EOP38_12120 [Rubrivivax sp.]